MKIKILILLVPIILTYSCGSHVPIISSKKYKIERPQTKNDKKVEIPKSKTTSRNTNEFRGDYSDVFKATIDSIYWLKWYPAYINDSEGVIMLKEAYVYRRNGKLHRNYVWPSKDIIANSNISDYLIKVGKHNPNSIVPIFSQETMRIDLIKVSDKQTKINFKYKIRPYTYSGMIGYEISSNGYIENKILKKINENLKNYRTSRR